MGVQGRQVTQRLGLLQGRGLELRPNKYDILFLLPSLFPVKSFQNQTNGNSPTPTKHTNGPSTAKQIRHSSTSKGRSASQSKQIRRCIQHTQFFISALSCHFLHSGSDTELVFPNLVICIPDPGQNKDDILHPSPPPLPVRVLSSQNKYDMQHPV